MDEAAPDEPRSTGPARRFYLWAALALVVLSGAAIWITSRPTRRRRSPPST